MMYDRLSGTSKTVSHLCRNPTVGPWYQHALRTGIVVDEAQKGNFYDPNPSLGSTSEVLSEALPVVVIASMAASVYHGYRRNQSIGWALWWGLMGSMFPVVTPAIAVAQGFGDRKE